MKIELEGIPNKPQAAALIALAVYAIAGVVFLCIDAEKTTELSTRGIKVILLLIPLAILYAILLLTIRAFPNVKEISSHIIKDNSFLADYGYVCKGFSYDKKVKELAVHFSHDTLPDVYLIDFIKQNTVFAYFCIGRRIMGIRSLAEYAGDSELLGSKTFKEYMEIFVKKIDLFKNLAFWHAN